MIPLLFRAKTATLLLLPPVTRPGEGNDKWNVLRFGCGILSQTEVPHTYAPAMLSKPEIKPHHGLHDMTVRWPAFLTAGRDEKYGLHQSLLEEADGHQNQTGAEQGKAEYIGDRVGPF